MTCNNALNMHHISSGGGYAYPISYWGNYHTALEANPPITTPTNIMIRGPHEMKNKAPFSSS